MCFKETKLESLDYIYQNKYIFKNISIDLSKCDSKYPKYSHYRDIF